MYADDSTVFSVAHKLAELQKKLSDELLTITKLAWINKLFLNIERKKTKCIIFSYKNNITKAGDLDLFIDGMPVEQVTNVKLLAVKIDNMLSWFERIDYRVKL